MPAPASSPTLVGRYAMFDRIAAGGMAAVHIGRLLSEGGFARTVAIKRLHPQFALDPDFATMFLDEARLAARIRHPNVVPTLDVVMSDGELFLVMEYIEGESLAALFRAANERSVRVPIDVAVGVMVQVLQGLHAAHEAKSDHGEPLGLVHRDVSPHNILVGAHGVVRVLDFGVAKALGQSHRTREGELKGKLGYLSPEQVLGHAVTRASDLFAAAVVLWESLAGRRLFAGDSEGAVLRKVIAADVPPPSTLSSAVPPSLDAAVLRALSKEPFDRFDSALAMAEALERAAPVAGPASIGRFARELASEGLAERARLLEAIECHLPATAEAAAPTSARRPSSHPSVVGDACDGLGGRSSIDGTGAPRPAMDAASQGRPRARLRWIVAAPLAAIIVAAAVENHAERRASAPIRPSAAPTGAVPLPLAMPTIDPVPPLVPLPAATSVPDGVARFETTNPGTRAAIARGKGPGGMSRATGAARGAAPTVVPQSNARSRAPGLYTRE